MIKDQNRGVGSHDAIKLLDGEQQVNGLSTMSQFDIHGSQWQGRGRNQSHIVQEIPQVQFGVTMLSTCHASGSAASGAAGVYQQKP